MENTLEEELWKESRDKQSVHRVPSCHTSFWMDYRAKCSLDLSGPCASKCTKVNKPSENKKACTEIQRQQQLFPSQSTHSLGVLTPTPVAFGTQMLGFCHSKGVTAIKVESSVFFPSPKYCRASNSLHFPIVSLKGIIFWRVKEGINAKSFLACAPPELKVKFSSDFSERKFSQWILFFSTKSTSSDT